MISNLSREYISQVTGYDSINFTITFPVDCNEYKVMKVLEDTDEQDNPNNVAIPTSGGSTNTSGVGTYLANSTLSTTINVADFRTMVSNTDGTYTLKVFVKQSSDNSWLNNEENSTVNITLDTVAPTLSYVVSQTTDNLTFWIYSNEDTITTYHDVDLDDDGTNLATSVEYNSDSIVFSVAKNSIYGKTVSLTVRVKDLSGNISEPLTKDITMIRKTDLFMIKKMEVGCPCNVNIRVVEDTGGDLHSNDYYNER